ncbi:hypothetical protein GRX01_12475 [Halobaculum sp. WSA2]|uniref:DUF2795 domain-containing protein n=1 Tax=Halobaculum saliterrae TaxID=2073113 RepID=A0A6B0T1J8_9EURY|nr:hypothetical protein [Halobaculum saliterrae]MXR42150.1 hypothetical protein [Halobaculum saliterrae]
MTTVRLSRVESLFEELTYPVARDHAAERFSDVTLRFSDGDGNLGEYVAECPSETFDSPEDLYADLNNVLPVEAVGEPGQSEGDG